MRPIKSTGPGKRNRGVSPNTDDQSFDLRAPDVGKNVGKIRAAVFSPILTDTTRSSAEPPRAHSSSQRDPDAKLEEALGLAEAIELQIVVKGLIKLPRVRPATLFGSGKVEELKAILKADDVELCVIDHPLSPVQQRNLERAWSVKILDRTGLILEIFGKRARTKEGRLQVELAHLTYQKSRLVRSWTHLERQRGGFGFLGGPGETQIEADRRIIQVRIGAIRKELEQVRRTRQLHRSGRRRVPFPIIALVGYTNAGKSSLFNRLTGAEVQAEDLLFATLDPTMRQVELATGKKVILSDTVGFISDLPTPLIAAFRATLEEVTEADIILHIRDIAHEYSEAQARDVNAVLEALGIDTQSGDTKFIEVWNKLDLVDIHTLQKLKNESARSLNTILVSAKTGQGLSELLNLIDDLLHVDEHELTVDVAPDDGHLIDWLHKNTQVLHKQHCETGSTEFSIRIPGPKLGQLQSLAGAKTKISKQDT